MRQISSVFCKFRQIRSFASFSRDNKIKMEELAKDIFNTAVEAVKPSELITKNKFLSYNKIGSKEVIEINHKQSSYQLDITDKKIHIGNQEL